MADAPSGTAAGPLTAARRPRRRRRLNNYRLAPALLIAINVVMFALFFVWPAAIGLWYSFTDYTGIGSPNFIGLKNYQQLFADSDFYAAFGRTLLFAVMVVPGQFVFSLLIASLLVSASAKGKTGARLLFFIPWLISPIVSGVIWRWLFGENFGLINFIIEKMGGHQIPWQSNANLSLLVVVIASIWGGTAFSMLLFVSALKNVPASYYEAAELDGTGAWKKFFYITLPLIAPTSFIVVLLGTLGAMKEYALLQSLNNGGPGTSNNLIVQYIYQTGFKQGQIGYASAASFILMLVLMIIALIQMAVNKRSEKR